MYYLLFYYLIIKLGRNTSVISILDQNRSKSINIDNN